MSYNDQLSLSPDVGILFEDGAISEVFCALLEARGVSAHVLSGTHELPGETAIITEPQFFPLLDQLHRRSCLVVGNKNSLREIPALSLSRPLTEEKVEEALARFLHGSGS